MPPVRQLKRDDVSFAYAAPQQPDSNLVGDAIEIPVGQAKLFALLRASCDHRRLVAERIDVVAKMVEQRLVAPQSGFDHGLPADRGPDILSHSEPPQNGRATRLLILRRGGSQRFARDDEFHNLRRPVADLQAEDVAQSLFKRQIGGIAGMAMHEQAGLHDLER